MTRFFRLIYLFIGCLAATVHENRRQLHAQSVPIEQILDRYKTHVNHFLERHPFLKAAVPYTKGALIMWCFLFFLHGWSLLTGESNIFNNNWARLYLILSLPSTIPLSVVYAINNLIDSYTTIDLIEQFHHPKFTPPSFALMFAGCSVLGLLVLLHLRLVLYYFSIGYQMVLKIKPFLNLNRLNSLLHTLRTINHIQALNNQRSRIYATYGKQIRWATYLLLAVIAPLLPVGIIDYLTYCKKYAEGLKQCKKELTDYRKKISQIKEIQTIGLVNAFTQGINKSNIPNKMNREQFERSSDCLACARYKNNCYDNNHGGSYSICWMCYNAYYEARQREDVLTKKLKGIKELKKTANAPLLKELKKTEQELKNMEEEFKKSKLLPSQTELGLFFKKLVSSDSSQNIMYSIPLNLSAPEEKALSFESIFFQLPQCLSSLDLYNFAAPLHIQKAYQEKVVHALGFQVDQCFFCGAKAKEHETDACPDKEANLKKLARWYAWYGGHGSSDFYLVYYAKLLITAIWYEEINTEFLRAVSYHAFQIEQPCPWCGYLTDKDDRCDHIAHCASCQKEWYFFTGKEQRPTSFYHSFFPRTYQLAEEITPFKQPALLGSGYFKNKTYPSRQVLIQHYFDTYRFYDII